MKLLRQGGPYCLIYSAAMVLDCGPEEIIKELGHDGSMLAWPDLIGDKRRKGVHIQELIPIFLRRKLALVPIEANPVLQPHADHAGYEPIPVQDRLPRFLNLIKGREGIIIMENHATAWNGHTVLDPQGEAYALIDSERAIISCWLALKLR